MAKKRKQFVLTPDAEAWLKTMADSDGASQNATIERLIRAEAKRRKLPKPEVGDES